MFLENEGPRDSLETGFFMNEVQGQAEIGINVMTEKNVEVSSRRKREQEEGNVFFVIGCPMLEPSDTGARKLN